MARTLSFSAPLPAHLTPEAVAMVLHRLLLAGAVSALDWGDPRPPGEPEPPGALAHYLPRHADPPPASPAARPRGVRQARLRAGKRCVRLGRIGRPHSVHHPVQRAAPDP